MHTRSPLLAAASALALHAATAFSILDFGGVPFSAADADATTNSAALFKAFLAANASADPSQRVVLVPAGYNFTVFAVPTISNVANLVVQIDGGLIVSDNFTSPAWPVDLMGGAILSIDTWCVCVCVSGHCNVGSGSPPHWLARDASPTALRARLKAVPTCGCQAVGRTRGAHTVLGARLSPAIEWDTSVEVGCVCRRREGGGGLWPGRPCLSCFHVCVSGLWTGVAVPVVGVCCFCSV
jgi:hypothetical protein